MFAPASKMEQAREVTRWLRQLADAVPVALCSGNHDDAGRQTLADLAPVYEWLMAPGMGNKIITRLLHASVRWRAGCDVCSLSLFDIGKVLLAGPSFNRSPATKA